MNTWIYKMVCLASTICGGHRAEESSGSGVGPPLLEPRVAHMGRDATAWLRSRSANGRSA